MVWSGVLRGCERFYHNMAFLTSTRACLVVVANGPTKEMLLSPSNLV